MIKFSLEKIKKLLLPKYFLIGAITVSIIILSNLVFMTINNFQSIKLISKVEKTDNVILNKYNVNGFWLTDNSLTLNTDNSINEFVAIITQEPTQTLTPVKTSTPKPIVTNSKSPTATPRPTSTITPIISPTVTSAIDYSHPWPVSPGCPTSTQNCVPCTSGSDCRYETGKTHGFRGWACQNNNPGNIRPGNASSSLTKDQMMVAMGGSASCGKRVDTRGGEYMVFRDYNTGRNSLKAYLRGVSAGMHSAYSGCGECSLRFFVSKYSPSSTNYADLLGSYMGINPDTTTLKTLVDTRLDDLASSIQRVEGFITQ